jgi:glycine betaine catabolism B
VNASYFRTLVVLNGALTFLLVMWDSVRGQLGANPVNTAIHITGVLSLVFLFTSLVVTPLRWMTGWNWLIAGRRGMGLLGFGYALLHFFIYVAWDRMGSLPSTFNEILERRFLTIGFIALLLMLPLAVTSSDGMIRWLGPIRWKQLHRLAYIVVILGVAHFYMLVKSDVRQPLIFASILTLLLGSRLGHFLVVRWKPDRRRPQTKAKGQHSKTVYSGQLEVVEIRNETSNVKTFRLKYPEGRELPFLHKPGQYMTLQINIAGRSTRRCYTIASSPSRRNFVELTIKRHDSGAVSRYMHDQVEVGMQIKVIAPAGKFWFDGNNCDSVCLIAGGVGITPPMSMLRYLTDTKWNGTIYFLNAIRTSQDIIYKEELGSLAGEYANLKLVHFLSQGESAHLSEIDGDSSERQNRMLYRLGRLDADTIQKLVPDILKTPVFMCGPEAMMDSIRNGLLAIGLSAEQIHTEEFTSPAATFSDSALPDDSTSEESTTLNSEFEVHFRKSKLTCIGETDRTLLELAEENDVVIAWECRAGICGQCKIRCHSGSVKMDNRDALSVAESKAGWVLACQAKVASHRIEVDA